MKIPASAIGRRATVRYRLDSGSATDAVGDILQVVPDVLVRRRTGEIVTVDPERVIVWKLVPPAPPPRRARRGLD